MKVLFAVLATLCSVAGLAAESASSAQSSVLSGQVLEVKAVESYTYLRLKTGDGEVWAAIGKTPVKTGAKVTIENVMVMNNFESKALKRTFPKLVFGTLAGAGAASGMSAAHAAVPKVEYAGDVKVPKASGPQARTVAEVVMKSAELKDKTVLIRGRVVKFTASIMGRNWIHLRDGSGSATDNTNDLLVTTADQARVDDVVVVKGVVRTDKDFGSGYAYKVLVEEATLQR